MYQCVFSSGSRKYAFMAPVRQSQPYCAFTSVDESLIESHDLFADRSQNSSSLNIYNLLNNSTQYNS